MCMEVYKVLSGDVGGDCGLHVDGKVLRCVKSLGSKMCKEVGHGLYVGIKMLARCHGEGKVQGR